MAPEIATDARSSVAKRRPAVNPKESPGHGEDRRTVTMVAERRWRIDLEA
jgi:hypothetical protein